MCPGGVMAGDCDRSISPIALTQNATVSFGMSEKLRRIQLLANSVISQGIKDNELGFTFRTENEELKRRKQEEIEWQKANDQRVGFVLSIS